MANKYLTLIDKARAYGEKIVDIENNIKHAQEQMKKAAERADESIRKFNVKYNEHLPKFADGYAASFSTSKKGPVYKVDKFRKQYFGVVEKYDDVNSILARTCDARDKIKDQNSKEWKELDKKAQQLYNEFKEISEIRNGLFMRGVGDYNRDVKNIDTFNKDLIKVQDKISKNAETMASLYGELTDGLKNLAKELHAILINNEKAMRDKVLAIAKECGTNVPAVVSVALIKRGMPGSFISYLDKSNADIMEETEDTAKALAVEVQLKASQYVGTITKAENVRLGNDGSANCTVYGENKGKTYKTTVETIPAGGYNIQCFHFRVIVGRVTEV